jgi:hypothetical protein
MNKSIHQSPGNTVRLLLMVTLVMALTLGTGQTARAAASPAPVDLGTAGHFAILTKTGITNVPISDITGDLGVSPIAAASITGFSLIADSTNTFSTSSQVTGKIYAANYADPTPANLTVSIANMETAYIDAAGRAPDYTELYAGNLSGKTLLPGVYKWSTGVLVTSNVTLAGPSNAVWIFQIAGNFTMGSGAKVLLSDGAQAANIFWQVGGGTGVEIGTTAHVEGTILAQKAIHLRTGASLRGRALAQTAVTLEKNRIVLTPSASPNYQRMIFKSADHLIGWVIESTETSEIGGSSNTGSSTFLLGDNAWNRQILSILSFNTSALPDNAVIVKVTLKIKFLGLVGTNPFLTHGGLKADIQSPFFGTTAGLVPSDFEAVAGQLAVGTFNPTPLDNWYASNINSAAYPFVNLTSLTQIRLRFLAGDNDDLSADYMKFYSGGLTTAPELSITYYLP